jgi:hypothetical protein
MINPYSELIHSQISDNFSQKTLETFLTQVIIPPAKEHIV